MTEKEAYDFSKKQYCLCIESVSVNEGWWLKNDAYEFFTISDFSVQLAAFSQGLGGIQRILLICVLLAALIDMAIFLYTNTRYSKLSHHIPSPWVPLWVKYLYTVRPRYTGPLMAIIYFQRELRERSRKAILRTPVYTSIGYYFLGTGIPIKSIHTLRINGLGNMTHLHNFYWYGHGNPHFFSHTLQIFLETTVHSLDELFYYFQIISCGSSSLCPVWQERTLQLSKS